MASLFDKPYVPQYLGQLGVGLLAAAQPQPYGRNRYSFLMRAVNQANQGLMQSRAFNLQKRQIDEERDKRQSQEQAQSTLYGGLDPTTGITWDTGRQGLMDNERLSLMAQASPEAFNQLMLERTFPKPVEQTYTYGNFVPEDGDPVAARRPTKGGPIETTGPTGGFAPITGPGVFRTQQETGGPSDYRRIAPVGEMGPTQTPEPGFEGDPSEAFGIPGKFKGIVNWLSGQVGTTVFKDALQSTQAIEKLNADTELQMSHLKSERDSVYAKKIIKDMLPKPPWGSDEAAHASYKEVVSQLRKDLTRNERIAYSQPGEFKEQAVSDARENVLIYQDLLSGYQEILDKWDTTSPGSPPPGIRIIGTP